MKHINTFEVGDRVWTIKGYGTVIAIDRPTVMTSGIYTIELDNEHGIYDFMKWQIQYANEESEDTE